MNQIYGAPTSKFTAAQIWSVALVVWLLGLCLLPDTNPLSSPAWATDVAKSIFSISEVKARPCPPLCYGLLAYR
jgi:hypothetical protein